MKLHPNHDAGIYAGIMSGTSLDGIDAVLVQYPPNKSPNLLGQYYFAYPEELRARILAIHDSQPGELHVSQVLAQDLARLYAQTVHNLLNDAKLGSDQIAAIGCHGQTIRHRPESGYTLQLVNGALLAELTGITSIIDFRSRDIAAGGHGAPLVPAFHAATLADTSEHRVIVNIGGISNLTNLPPSEQVSGFDCGPGNLLMNAWAERHLGKPYDENGIWAASGNVLPALLDQMLANPFFNSLPPKSAGREQFNIHWLEGILTGKEATEDIQATLLELTARGITDAARLWCPGFDALYVCGGGVHNTALMKRLHNQTGKPVHSTSNLGIDPDWMEAMAFAWLAKQCQERQPANLPAVTGAKGPRILGAIYPA